MDAPFPPSPYQISDRWRSLAGPPDDYWPRLGTRIAIAGGIYPLVVMAGWLIVILAIAFGVTLTNGVSSRPQPSEVAAILLGPIFASPFLFGAGFMLAGVLSMLVIPAVALTVHLLGEPPRRDTLGMACGSVVAAIATLPLSLVIFGDAAGTASPRTTALVATHVALAIAFGQAAGALASLSDLRRRARGRLAPRRFRLSLWHIVAGMVPLSLGLGLLKATGLLTPSMAVSTAMAVVAHLALNRPARWSVNRWADRRVARRRTERAADFGAATERST